MKIQTDRLTIDPLSVNDRDFMRRLVNTEGWLKFIGNRNVDSDEAAAAYIQKILTTPDFTYQVVHLKATGEPTGIVSFIKRTYLDHFDIGFAFLPEHSGKGYALEASRAMLSHMQKQPQHKTVLATTVPGNTASIKLLKKLGFRFDKEMDSEKGRLHVYTTDAEKI